MRNLNGFKWIYALAIFGTAANADLIIDSQSIPSSDISSISISPASGNIFVSTIPGYDVSKSGTEPPPPGEVAITSFSASPSTIIVGQSTTLSWATSNATSCTPSGGTGGWSTRSIALPNGNTAIIVSAVSSYEFTLTCTGDAGSPAVRNITVTANPEPDPNSCPTPALSGIEVDWINLFLVDFPMPGYDNRFTTIPQTGYYALKFNTGNVVDDGKMSSIETTVTDGVRLGAFSKCPGDFDVAPECDFVWGISGGIRWATNGRVGACQLEPNTDYYFNITYTDGEDDLSSTCNSSPCITTLQHVNQ